MKQFETWSKLSLSAFCVAVVTAVGLVDYVTGYETFFFIFYLVAVFLAVWFVGVPLGILISALSVIAWVSTNIAAGERYSSYFVPVWNALIMFAFYLVVVGLLAKLRTLQQGLEERVRRRTVALTREIEERMRLQTELLAVSEREQRRISHDLHDGLCQHLTGTALGSHVLGEKLAAQALPEAGEANRLAALVEEAIELTRTLARGLYPMEANAGQVFDNFRELAASKSKRFKVDCRFECHEDVPLTDPKVAAQLFRIAQEATLNAIRHGQAQHINICLDAVDGEIALTITDDGQGLPESATNGPGMGLRLMAYRADMIGATFKIEPLPRNGTRVTCLLPTEGQPTSHVKKN
jgi:signal transduction histidine kinase